MFVRRNFLSTVILLAFCRSDIQSFEVAWRSVSTSKSNWHVLYYVMPLPTMMLTKYQAGAPLLAAATTWATPLVMASNKASTFQIIQGTIKQWTSCLNYRYGVEAILTQTIQRVFSCIECTQTLFGTKDPLKGLCHEIFNFSFFNKGKFLTT